MVAPFTFDVPLIEPTVATPPPPETVVHEAAPLVLAVNTCPFVPFVLG